MGEAGDRKHRYKRSQHAFGVLKHGLLNEAAVLNGVFLLDAAEQGLFCADSLRN